MRKIIFFLVAVYLPATGFSKGPGNEAARDTATAVVVYDADAKFIPHKSISVDEYSALIDSLVQLDTIPVALVNQLNVYRTLALRNPAELSQVIDSIFESPHVPKSVLNAVNIYMTAMRESMDVPTGFAAFIPQDTSPYPANVFYRDWNTEVPNPSRNSLTGFDSTLTLLLVDSAQNCGFHTPFAGVVTSTFGWRYGRNHNGIDIDLEVWDPVHAAFPGVVRVARYYKGFGRVVVIRHHNGLETTYAHLHRFKVKPGDEVDAGDIVGLGGSSGNSTGSHLHFEIRFQGVPIKPSQIIDFRKHTLRNEVVHLQRAGAFIASVPEGGRIYEVKKGDYLYKIAKESGVTVDKLRELNHFARNETLRVGQKIRIGT